MSDTVTTWDTDWTRWHHLWQRSSGKSSWTLQVCLKLNNVILSLNKLAIKRVWCSFSSLAFRINLNGTASNATTQTKGTQRIRAVVSAACFYRNHYLEYLSRLVRSRNIDPLPILGVDDLETLVRRAALRLPPRPYGSLEGLYKRGLTEVCLRSIFLQDALRGVPGGSGARARPHPYHGCERARGRVAAPRAAAARARALGHWPHIRRHVCWGTRYWFVGDRARTIQPVTSHCCA